MVSLPINFRNKSFIGNRRPFLLNTLKQPPFVPVTNGGSLRIRLANPYQRILYFSLKTMFCVLKLNGVLLKQPPFVPGTFS